MVGEYFEHSIDESTEIIYGLKNVTARLLLDVYKTIEKIDIYTDTIGFTLLLYYSASKKCFNRTWKE